MLVEGGDHFAKRDGRVARGRCQDVVHGVVERLDFETALHGGVVPRRRLGERRIGNALPGSAAVRERPEPLEAGAAQRRILGEKKVAAPKTLSTDRAVRLPVDRVQDAPAFFRFRQALGDDQNVPVRIGEHGARTKRVPRQIDGIVVALVFGKRSAARAGVHAVGQRAPNEHAEGVRGERFGVSGRIGMRDEAFAVGGRTTTATGALRHAERQSELPREGCAEDVRQVGTVRPNDRGVVRVFAHPEVVEEKVLLRIPEHFVERGVAYALAFFCIEERLDPCGIQVFGGDVPRARRGPERGLRGSRPRLRAAGGEHGHLRALVGLFAFAVGLFESRRELRSGGDELRREKVGRPAAALDRGRVGTFDAAREPSG